MNTSTTHNIKNVSDCLLEVGALLMGAGASTNRIKLTIDRISHGLGYDTELLATHRTILIVVKHKTDNTTYNSFRKTPPHGANFNLVSGISKLSWKVIQEQWSIAEINNRLDTLKHRPRYSLLTTLILVSLADAAFCRLFGASHVDMATAFTATAIAFLARHYVLKLKFNPYLCISFASCIACLITGGAVKLGIGHHPELAFNTAVLFLIPGIPLINSFSDLIEGYTMNGLVRGTHAMLIALSIAFGMLATMYIYNF
ncbi:threonine/serine ThrE exporter family protein [Formosa sp. A9]|uniref:threonine/serine ThrE exporter family protein n=1 Tax=Formosa sp. A9 TaxID=3442641 RepID=UPI003EBA0C8A